MKRLVLSLVSFAAIGLTACQGHAPTGPSESPAFGSPSGALNEDSGGSSLKARLTANPSTINAGETSTLTWTTSNARSVYLDGVAVAKSGSKNVSPTATKTYSLLAVNGSRRTTSTATVTVSSGSGGSGDGAEAGGDDGTPSPTPPPPTPTPPPTGVMPTATLTPPSATIQSGQSVTLTWSTTDATSATMNGVSVALNGSRTYTPTTTTTYELVATNAAGSATATSVITVTSPTPTPAPLPTALITAMPELIQSGQSSTLQWSTSNATSVTLNGSAVGANGSRVVSPTVDTTYTIMATNASGSVQSMVTVTVTAAPPPPPPPPPPAGLTWVNDIQPITSTHCTMCHSGPFPTAGYDLSTYASAMTRVTPFDPNSRILQMIGNGTTNGPMTGYLIDSTDPTGHIHAKTIYDWIVTYGAPQQ